VFFNIDRFNIDGVWLIIHMSSKKRKRSDQCKTDFFGGVLSPWLVNDVCLIIRAYMFIPPGTCLQLKYPDREVRQCLFYNVEGIAYRKVYRKRKKLWYPMYKIQYQHCQFKTLLPYRWIVPYKGKVFKTVWILDTNDSFNAIHGKNILIADRRPILMETETIVDGKLVILPIDYSNHYSRHDW
jgi:hypothetical protein